MGIRFHCPYCRKRLNVKAFLAGKRGICPYCDSGLDIPLESEPRNGKQPHASEPVEEQTIEREEERSTPAADTAVPRVATSGPVDGGPVSSGGNEPSYASEAAPARQPTYESAPVETPVGLDPIEENPEAVWYVRPPSGGQFGPAKGDVMRKWLAEGRVSPDSLVWREGWADWQEAEPTFPMLGNRSAPPPPPTPEPASRSAPAQAVAVAAPAQRVVAAENASAPLSAPDPLPDNTATKALQRHRSPVPALIAVGALVVLSIGLLVGLIVVLASK